MGNMPKRILLLILLNWFFSISGMYEIYNQEQELLKVARRLGFRMNAIEIHQTPHNQAIYTYQDFGKGYIFLIRDNKSKMYYILSCAFDDGVIKKNRLQTDWMPFSQALMYQPDMIPKFTPQELELISNEQ